MLRSFFFREIEEIIVENEVIVVVEKQIGEEENVDVVKEILVNEFEEKELEEIVSFFLVIFGVFLQG